MTGPKQWITRIRRSDEDGMTMTELMVGMIIMTIFGSIFTTAIVSMFSASNKVQAVENSSAQLNTAFDRLDKQVRYASYVAVNSAGTSAALTSVNTGVAATCIQLQLQSPAAGQPLSLMERTFTYGSTPPNSWSQLAGGVLAPKSGDSVKPFTPLLPANGVQQLQLHLAASDISDHSQSASASEITLSVLNYSSFVSQQCQPAS